MSQEIDFSYCSSSDKDIAYSGTRNAFFLNEKNKTKQKKALCTMFSKMAKQNLISDDKKIYRGYNMR